MVARNKSTSRSIRFTWEISVRVGRGSGVGYGRVMDWWFLGESPPLISQAKAKAWTLERHRPACFHSSFSLFFSCSDFPRDRYLLFFHSQFHDLQLYYFDLSRLLILIVLRVSMVDPHCHTHHFVRHAGGHCGRDMIVGSDRALSCSFLSKVPLRRLPRLLVYAPALSTGGCDAYRSIQCIPSPMIQLTTSSSITRRPTQFRTRQVGTTG